MPNTPNPSEHNNSHLIYEYTENCLNDASKDIDLTNGKLTAVVASSAVLLKFTENSAVSGFGYELVQSLACLFLIAAIWLCLCGLRPQKYGHAADPEELIDKYFYVDDEEYRLLISRNRIETRKELESIYDKKAEKLQDAYTCLVLAATLIGGSIICSGVLPT